MSRHLAYIAFALVTIVLVPATPTSSQTSGDAKSADQTEAAQKPASIPEDQWKKMTKEQKAEAIKKDQAKTEADKATAEREAAEKKEAEKKKAASEAGNDVTQNKFGLGLGIGVSRLGDSADVLETQVVNRVIRVTDTENVRRGVWLETHYLLDRYARRWNYASHGPFFGVQAGTTESVFTSVAFGYMFSLKRTPKWDTRNKAAFNFGLGLYTTKGSSPVAVPAGRGRRATRRWGSSKGGTASPM